MGFGKWNGVVRAVGLGLLLAAGTAAAQETRPEAAVEMLNGDSFRARILQDVLVLRTEYATLHFPLETVSLLENLELDGLIEVVVGDDEFFAGYLLPGRIGFELTGGLQIEAEAGEVSLIELGGPAPPTPVGAVPVVMQNGDEFRAVPTFPGLTLDTAYGALSFPVGNIAGATLQPDGRIELTLRDDQGRFNGTLLDEELSFTLRSGETIRILPWHINSIGIERSVESGGPAFDDGRADLPPGEFAAFTPPSTAFAVPEAGLQVLLDLAPGAYRLVVESNRDPFAALYQIVRNEAGEAGLGDLLSLDDDTGPDDAAQVDICVPAAREFGLVITDFDNEAADAVVSIAPLDLLEPLPPGQAVSRQIAGNTGSWVVFEIVAPGDYVLSAVSQTEGFDPWIELVGAAGTIGVDDDGGAGLNSRLRAQLESGTYCLRVLDINSVGGAVEIAVRSP